ncbi:MAG: hypothetical protein IPL84_16350 [Chitinophagaceae bacterium]|nr:hypothetical protein [Chitinophagaceae bacterium]
MTQTVSVPVNNIEWVKKGKEVIINGKYFDVSSYTTVGDQVLLTGYFDQKEDKIVSHIKKVFHQSGQSESPYTQSAVKYIFLLVYTTHTEAAFTVAQRLINTKFYSYCEKIPEAPYSSFSPPPEL